MDINSSKINIEYTTPINIYTYYWKEIKDLDYLAEKTINNVGPMDYKTNVLGKMTDYQFFIKNKTFIKILTKVLLSAKDHLKSLKSINEILVTEAWGAILNKDDYVKSHNHEVCSLVGVIYLSDGEKLHFYKSHEQIPENIIYSITPKKGTIILFPSWCNHGTEKSKSDQPRVCLPFNLYYKPAIKYKVITL